MEPQDVMIRGTRVWVAELSTSEKNLADLKAVVQEKHFNARRAQVIGSVSKGVAGIDGNVVLVKHEDDDGHGRWNGEVAAYYAFELEPLNHKPLNQP